MTKVWAKPSWLVFAEHELGQAEIAGAKDNPRILEYWRIAGLQAENRADNELTSWCGCFDAAMMSLAKIKPWGDASARSWGRPGAAVKLARPEYGAVAVKARTGGLAWQGHTGFVVAMSPDGKWVCLLAGNQGDKVSYAWFHMAEFQGASNLGFFWPIGVANPNQGIPLLSPGATVQPVKEA